MSHRFLSCPLSHLTFFFFFNDTAPTDIYTLSLHDALPICELLPGAQPALHMGARRGRVLLDQLSAGVLGSRDEVGDRKSTRLNSSHRCISYAVFCLKKKKKKYNSE